MKIRGLDHRGEAALKRTVAQRWYSLEVGTSSNGYSHVEVEEKVERYANRRVYCSVDCDKWMMTRRINVLVDRREMRSDASSKDMSRTDDRVVRTRGPRQLRGRRKIVQVSEH